MDKYQQIMKLAEAAQLVDEVRLNFRVTDDQAEKLQEIVDDIANIADEIEGA